MTTPGVFPGKLYCDPLILDWTATEKYLNLNWKKYKAFMNNLKEEKLSTLTNKSRRYHQIMQRTATNELSAYKAEDGTTIEEQAFDCDVPEVTLTSMLTSLLPAVPDLSDVCKKLQDDNRVTGNGWKRRLRPSKDKAHGPKAFKNLAKIYNNIHASRSSGQGTVKLTINDHSTPLSSRRNSGCPDGFGSIQSAQLSAALKYLPTTGSVSAGHWR
ncbi:hypothetical protein BDP27DRAFT_1360049 [Rhodocollybia butyracea]|uniref:Uncharacterized protein n=1 Tax=Rhodocollybia butyracea TaxID=206335 RepID=A0A9P5UC63_9AGAR|nr:hypothetical protein BDP27DRAFT_1360049 [Rhodocollybia butyracea]